jgi:flagellum-specific peptidoglycan hydrolase FlgJ
MTKVLLLLEAIVLAIGLQVQGLQDYVNSFTVAPKTEEVYAGRSEKVTAKTLYSATGLPTERDWLTHQEWKGDHCKTKKQKKAFKQWKKAYIAEYIQWWSKAAQAEYKINKVIPPSLIIAQAILESGYGLSRLAVLGDNYFGHKHKGKDASKFMIVADDSPTDKFTKYKSRWFSLRAHVKLLQGMYFKRLKGKPTLENWLVSLCGGMTHQEAKKFRKAGNKVYATSCMTNVCYSQKLQNVVDMYDLEKYDK